MKTKRGSKNKKTIFSDMALSLMLTDTTNTVHGRDRINHPDPKGVPRICFTGEVAIKLTTVQEKEVMELYDASPFWRCPPNDTPAWLKENILVYAVQMGVSLGDVEWQIWANPDSMIVLIGCLGG